MASCFLYTFISLFANKWVGVVSVSVSFLQASLSLSLQLSDVLPNLIFMPLVKDIKIGHRNSCGICCDIKTETTVSCVVWRAYRDSIYSYLFMYVSIRREISFIEEKCRLWCTDVHERRTLKYSYGIEQSSTKACQVLLEHMYCLSHCSDSTLDKNYHHNSCSFGFINIVTMWEGQLWPSSSMFAWHIGGPSSIPAFRFAW